MKFEALAWVMDERRTPLWAVAEAQVLGLGARASWRSLAQALTRTGSGWRYRSDGTIPIEITGDPGLKP